MSEQKIVPYLWFDTQGEDAATYYVDVFNGRPSGDGASRIVDVSRYGEAGPREPGTVLTAEFDLEGQRFVALNGGPDFTFNEAVSFLVRCADQAEVDYFWDRLIADGGEDGPCGWLKDRYGLSWQIIPDRLGELLGDPDPGRAQRAMEAMLKMGKIEVAELDRAADAA